MRISLRRLREARNFDEMNAQIRLILSDISSQNDEAFISDLILNEIDGGSFPLLDRLRRDHGKKYYLKVLGDEWGKKVKPGDVVRRKFKEPLQRVPGTPIASSVISNAVRAGTFERDFFRFEEFVVDENGCIKCSADDMWYFLTHFGIHCYSRQPLSMYVNERSSDPQKNQKTGEMGHRLYWRFEEVETKEYAKLPKLNVNSDNNKDTGEKKDPSEKKR
jgi:hypothetical protein